MFTPRPALGGGECVGHYFVDDLCSILWLCVAIQLAKCLTKAARILGIQTEPSEHYSTFTNLPITSFCLHK